MLILRNRNSRNRGQALGRGIELRTPTMLSLDHSCPSQICSSWNYLRKTWPAGQISILISAIGTTLNSPQKPSCICVRLYKTGDGTGLIRFYSNPFRGSSNLFQSPGGDSKWKSWQKLSWAQVPGFQFPNFQQQPWMSSKLLRGAKTLGFDNCILEWRGPSRSSRLAS